MEEERIEVEQEEEITLEEVRDALLRQINGGLTDEEIEPTLAAFNAVSRAIADRDKALNEANRIEMEEAKSIRETAAAEAKSVREAETAANRSKNELVGNGLRAGAQIGAAVVAGWVSIVTVARIINAEDKDQLVVSKALSFILKPRG